MVGTGYIDFFLSVRMPIATGNKCLKVQAGAPDLPTSICGVNAESPLAFRVPPGERFNLGSAQASNLVDRGREIGI